MAVSFATAAAQAEALSEKQESIHALERAAGGAESSFATVNLVADKATTFRAVRPVLEACALRGVAVSLITVQ